MSGASKILMGSGGVVLPSDDEFNNVSFLSHFDGSNNGTNIVYDDSSDSNHTISVTGTPSQGTFSPFSRAEGEWSNYFGGSADVIYTTATGSEFAFGTGDFTVEGWFWPEGVAGAGGTTYVLAAGNMITIYTYQNNSINIYMALSNAAAASSTVVGVNSTLLLHQWNHFAISRSGSNMSVFLNGTRIQAVTDASGTFLAPTGGGSLDNIQLGAYDTSGSYDFDGYISNIRLVKGTAVYDPTSSSCTVPTSGLTAISGTSLLTCQSNRFKDNSSSAHTLTVAGSPKVTAFTPILTSEVYDSAVNGASAYFDGTDGYLSAADSSDWDLGSGSYTVEAWVWAGAGVTASTFNNIVGQWPQTGAASTNSWIMENSGGVVVGYAVIGGTATLVAQSATLPLAQWVHVALVRNGNAHNIYLNGVAGATTTNTNAYDTGTGAVEVGGFSHSSLADGNWDGYISNVRVVKGTAVYTSNFTPPTAPLTAITNTALLLNMADGQVLDSAAQNNVTLYGTADTSTTQQKFGTSSLFLEGDSDTDFAQLHGVKDLSGPFTIECWARAADTDNAYMWCQGMYTIELQLNGNNLSLYTAAASGHFFSSGEFTVNTWHHVALVRDTSNVIKCYLNGTASGTTFSNGTAFAATYGLFFIGGEFASSTSISHGWDGYIDEFRISRFARYTSNFTPATEAFPDKGQ